MPPEIILTTAEPQICALSAIDPEPCPVCNDRTCNRVELEQAVQPHLSKTAWDAARSAADAAKAHCDANAYNWRAVAKELARRLSEQDKVVLQLEASQLAWQAKIAQETKDLLDKRAVRLTLTPQANEALLNAAADKHWAELLGQNTSETKAPKFKDDEDPLAPLDPLGWQNRIASAGLHFGLACIALGRTSEDVSMPLPLRAQADSVRLRVHRMAHEACALAEDALHLAPYSAGVHKAQYHIGGVVSLLDVSPSHRDLHARRYRAGLDMTAALEALESSVPAPVEPPKEPDPPVKVNPDKVFDKAYKLALDALLLLLGAQRLFGDMAQTTAHSYRVRLLARINRDLGKVEDKLDGLRDLIRETGDVLDPDNLERVKECQGHLQTLAMNLRCTDPDHTPEVHKHVSGYFEPAERALSNLRNRLDSSCPWGPKRKAKK